MTLPSDLAPRLEALEPVRRAVVVDEVDSTNLAARREVADGAGPGLVVVAERQTAGRGRRGRTWADVAGGNLALSVVVELPTRPTLLPLVAALGVRDVLAGLGISTSWKWPNDVRAMLRGRPRKCAGILVETESRTGRPTLGVVGIGVDVDWREATRTRETTAWTSLAEVLDRDVEVDRLALQVVAALGTRLAELHRDPDLVVRAAREACDTLGSRVRVEGEQRVLVGLAHDLTPDGALLLEVDGHDVVVTAGDVVHLRDA